MTKSTQKLYNSGATLIMLQHMTALVGSPVYIDTLVINAESLEFGSLAPNAILVYPALMSTRL